MSNNLNLIKTILISWGSAFVGYLISFIVTPYITETLGVEAYGFVSIANNVVSYAGILTIAITSFIVRYISVSYHENKYHESREYFSSSLAACVVSVLMILAIAVVLILRLEYLLVIPESLIIAVKILFCIVFLNFAVSTVANPFFASFYIKNRLDVYGITRIVGKIAEALLIILLFYFLAPQVWYVSIGALTASVIMMTGGAIFTKKLTPDLFFESTSVSIKKIRDLIVNGMWNSFNQLGNILNSGLDLIISNLMLTTTGTGQIAVAKTVSAIFSTVFQSVGQVFQPQLIKTYAKEDKKEFFTQLSKAMRFCGFFGCVSFAGFVSLGKVYFELWLPSQDTQMLYCLTVITLVNYITDSILQPVYFVSTLTIKNKIPCFVTIIGGSINVISMYLLLKYTLIGVYVVVSTTAVIMITINLLFNPIYAARCLKIKSLFFYNQLVKHIIATFLLTVTFMLFSKVYMPHTWMALILTTIVYSIIGVIMYTALTYRINELRGKVKKIDAILRNK